MAHSRAYDLWASSKCIHAQSAQPHPQLSAFRSMLHPGLPVNAAPQTSGQGCASAFRSMLPPEVVRIHISSSCLSSVCSRELCIERLDVSRDRRLSLGDLVFSMAVVRTDPQFSLVSLEEFAIRNAPTHVEWYGDSRTSRYKASNVVRSQNSGSQMTVPSTPLERLFLRRKNYSMKTLRKRREKRYG